MSQSRIRQMLQRLGVTAGLVVGSVLGPVALADSTPIGAGDLLQKLSLRLRGTVPTPAETSLFTARIAAEPDHFQAIYDEQIATYLASPEFHGVAENLHAVWWRLPKGETTRFVADLVMQDRPYWEIFDRDYVYLDGAAALKYAAVDIKVEGVLPSVNGDWRYVRLADDETRFRSVLSDLDVLNRFPDTPTNRNRARANNIFRTFLCESLTPSTPIPDSEPITDVGPTTFDDDQHGSDPDCMGCHYRLDPLARFFDQWRPPFPDSAVTWFDGSQEAKGKLVVRPEGAAPRIGRGTTESELALILKDEPAVHQCVVKRAWDFVFGTGIKLVEADEKRLLQVFDQRASYKDMLAEVLHHPYFWSTDEAPALRFADVKTHFSGCGGSCHKIGGSIQPAFDPQVYPFDADPIKNVALLTQIWGAINHAAGYTPMPRTPRPKLPSESLQQVRDWISVSAQDNTGHETLTDAQIREVFDE